MLEAFEHAHWKEKKQVMGSYHPTKARVPAEAGSNSLAFMACKQGCGSWFFFPCELEVYMATARPGVGVLVSGDSHVWTTSVAYGLHWRVSYSFNMRTSRPLKAPIPEHVYAVIILVVIARCRARFYHTIAFPECLITGVRQLGRNRSIEYIYM